MADALCCLQLGQGEPKSGKRHSKLLSDGLARLNSFQKVSNDAIERHADTRRLKH
jgi:hypothetical protein